MLTKGVYRVCCIIVSRMVYPIKVRHILLQTQRFLILRRLHDNLPCLQHRLHLGRLEHLNQQVLITTDQAGPELVLQLGLVEPTLLGVMMVIIIKHGITILIIFFYELPDFHFVAQTKYYFL